MSSTGSWFASRIPWLVFPATMVLVLTLHALMARAGASVGLSSYLPVFLGAGLVTWLELRFPEKHAWRPQFREVRQDLLYMIAVQMVLPKALGFAAAIWAAGISRDYPTGLWQLWPHDWPLALQAGLIVLVADFLRYWLHRAAHNYGPLWRLHAVHHSPHRLYWLNVGRFHPLEKAVQFLFDSLPFVLLGVAPEVIAIYFVFYAVNGFFQHSNIKLRYGVLNYVISSAELHRWHHSKLVRESNTNYGNNIIIWDILFGTRFLPSDRYVGDLGLKNRNYPMGFLAQLWTPLTPAIVDQDAPEQGLRGLAARWAFRQTMRWVRVVDWWPFMRALRQPQAVQGRVLRHILHENRKTRFGREHGFAEIRSYEDFVERVPVQYYESHRPYIEEQESGRTAALTSTMPVMYAVTSGTTGQPTFLPVLSATLREYRQEQRLMANALFAHCPAAFSGKSFMMVGAAIEGERPSGIPFGSVSGCVYQSMPSLMRANTVVPPEVYGIGDSTLKYRVMLRLALQEPEITYFGGANPSAFLRMADVLNDSRDLLADSLTQGSIAMLGELDEDVQRVVEGRLQRLPAVAERLRDMPRVRPLTFADFWPSVRLLTIWTGGSCGLALNALTAHLPVSTRVVELGYLASEFRGTVTIDPETGAGAPTLHHHFLEFIEPADWEAGRRDCLQLHELQPDRDYFVIVTTGSGLYRYFMNDIVRVVGRFQHTPTLRFVQKGRGVTSITGEKLYEGQVLQAVRDVSERFGLVPRFVMALADEASNVYRLYIEPAVPFDNDTVAAAIDARLAELNIEYRAKRDSRRLTSLRAYVLKPGTGEDYKAYCLGQGQRDGQFKTVALQYAREFGFDLTPYISDTLDAARQK